MSDGPEENPAEVESSGELAAAAEEHDPTGVDLARQIAASVSAIKRPAAKPRKRRPPRPTGVQSSGSHPDDRDPMLVGDALDRLVGEKGWNTQVNIHLLLGNWPRLVGAVNAQHSQPESFADGILTVRTSSTAWATQLRLFAPQLVARLNKDLGDGSVTRINVKGPDAPSWKHGRRSVRGRGPRDTYG
ncbi:DciA family protein [Ammonicoccus fulvus]|uniref:DciA family protein n=1 Tax=Ammonicoccus fulvus TaxID=3138240 RepID=A0ABZ3FSX4_9ACTN